MPRGARCVQRFDDSLNSAIHITYRISLRSSSMREPRDPLLKVVLICVDRKCEHSMLLCVRVKTQAPPLFTLKKKRKGTHAVMHKGVMDVNENARGVHDLEGQQQPRHPLVLR
jgi:hypothetical protein